MNKFKNLSKLILILGLLFIIISFILFYLSSPVDKNNKKNIDVEIKQGTSTIEASKILKKKNLIRSKTLFNFYAKLDRKKTLKAGVYQFNKSMNLKEIINNLQKGSTYNPKRIEITFKEGENVKTYIEKIEKNTNYTFEEIKNTFNDRVYLKELINKYWFLKDDILNDEIYYPLEGYLKPDTYFFEEDVTIKEIIITLLDHEKILLDKYKNKIKDINEVIILSSIVELEGTNLDNKKMIIGIFKNRLNSGMNLGSDVTTYYGLQIDMNKDLSSSEFQKDNAYNTRSVNMIGKLPVGAISNPSEESIDATVNYSDNDYLFFVADKNGKIYYSKTNAEHEKLTQEIKNRGDWIW